MKETISKTSPDAALSPGSSPTSSSAAYNNYSTFQHTHTAVTKEANPALLYDSISSHYNKNSCWERILSSYVGPRLLLMVASAIYATNFPLGALMDESLPASAATARRMTVAAVTLSFFLCQLKPHLRVPAATSGLFSAIAYVTQSLALVHTNPARVSFLGSAIVLVVPVLEATVDRKPMGIRDAPQTWLAAFLCFAGVGVLELNHSTSNSSKTELNSGMSMTGDILALIQAVGFGTSCFINNKILRRDHGQALPVTAMIIATTAVSSLLWCLADGWVFSPNWFQYTLPGMLLDPTLHAVAGAVLWTGLVSTSFNYSLELTALGRVPASEAPVILALEPLWAAFFAAALYGTPLTLTDWIGGLLIVSACMVNATLEPSHFYCLTQRSTPVMEEYHDSGGDFSSEASGLVA